MSQNLILGQRRDISEFKTGVFLRRAPRMPNTTSLSTMLSDPDYRKHDNGTNQNNMRGLELKSIFSFRACSMCKKPERGLSGYLSPFLDDQKVSIKCCSAIPENVFFQVSILRIIESGITLEHDPDLSIRGQSQNPWCGCPLSVPKVYPGWFAHALILNPKYLPNKTNVSWNAARADLLRHVSLYPSYMSY